MAKLFVLLCVVLAHCAVAFQNVKTRTTLASSLYAAPGTPDGLINKVISKGGAALTNGDPNPSPLPDISQVIAAQKAQPNNDAQIISQVVNELK